MDRFANARMLRRQGEQRRELVEILSNGRRMQLRPIMHELSGCARQL